MISMRKNSQPGQILVIFAIVLIVLIALAALVLDGGQLLLSRRNAQAAADAGALAGAYRLCSGSSASSAISTAQDFAITQNGASTAIATITSGEVTVNTTISHDSFFAKIFNIQSLNVSATASAGCFPPSNLNKVLPIAWSCKPPSGSVPSSSTDCEIQSLDWVTQMQPLLTGTPSSVNIGGTNYTTPFDFDHNILPQIYIIMDSASSINDVTVNCPPLGTMVCDINGDGKIDIIGNGDRSWLDLDGGGGGASSLSNWLRYGYNNPLAIHTWLAGQTGVANSVFQSVDNYAKGRVNFLPVFNQFCSGNPTAAACQDAAHVTEPLPPATTDTIVWSSGASTTYFHIIGFAEFYVTCVDAPGASGHCPGHTAAVNAGSFANNTKTIEGYFVRGYNASGSGGAGTGGVNLGVYVRSLTH